MSGFADVADKFGKMKKEVKPRLAEAAHDSLVDTSRQMNVELIKSDAVASHETRRSLNVQRSSTTPPKAFVQYEITGAPWWKYIEFGTGIYTTRGYSAADPFPPFKPIYQWVLAKGITPDPDSDNNTQEEVAYAIQRSLSTGTPMQRFVRPTWRGPRGKSHLVREIERTINDIVSL